MAGGRVVLEDIVAHVDLLRQRAWDVLSSIDGTLLLPSLSLLVLFLLVGGVLAVIIRHVDLIGKLDAKAASFDPGCLRLERDRAWCEAV